MTKKFSPTFWCALFLSIGMGVMLFVISQENEKQRQVLQEMNAAIEFEKDRIALYEAEWAYLNNPERIEGLIKKVRQEREDNKGGQQVAVVDQIPKVKAIMPPKNKPEYNGRLLALRGN